MTRHYPTPLSKARYWLDLAREATRLQRPALALEPSHNAVHNAVVALRNLLSHERGKVRHRDVPVLAIRLGVPEAIARQVKMVETLKPLLEYGVQVPAPETGADFHRAAEAVVAHVEETFRTRGRIPGSRTRRRRPGVSER